MICFLMLYSIEGWAEPSQLMKYVIIAKYYSWSSLNRYYNIWNEAKKLSAELPKREFF